ncbi:MAG TPA: DUF6183 family protein [Acidimicrobiales bacterium]|nr:DUF6183 family protein [Acidimicrobiales bacterium]
MSDAELDGLIREVDQLCERRDWDGLVALRDRCREALKRGKQFWPAASFAEYRLALEAPGPWARLVVADPDAGRFALGPLSEVAASTHAWDDIAGPGPSLAMAAHERVVRGEDVRGDARVDAAVLDLPLALEGWEPAYPVAEYKPDEAQFPTPPVPVLRGPAVRAAAAPMVDDADAVRALVEVAGAWTTESNGRAEAVAVLGDASGAVAALGAPRVRLTALSPGEALAWLAWAGASGGAHGRRRGMALGRFNAWWALAAVAGLLDDWPVPGAELGAAAEELRWFWWDAGEPDTGWQLRLAVEDPEHGRAFAVLAIDAD